MVDVVLNGLSPHLEEGTIQSWFYEEGDPVSEGDELVEIMTEDGTVTITAPAAGVLSEVYYDEGDAVGRGEILCSIEVEGDDDKDEDEEEDDDDEKEKDKE